MNQELIEFGNSLAAQVAAQVLAAVEPRFEKLDRDVEGLKSDVAGLKSDVEGLKSDVEGLKARVERLEARVERLEADGLSMRDLIRDTSERLANHIANVGGSLHTQMQEMEDRLNARHEVIQARVDRQGAMLIAGGRWVSRMITWSEKVDGILEERDARLMRLDARLRKIEQGPE